MTLGRRPAERLEELRKGRDHRDGVPSCEHFLAFAGFRDSHPATFLSLSDGAAFMPLKPSDQRGIHRVLSKRRKTRQHRRGGGALSCPAAALPAADPTPPRGPRRSGWEMSSHPCVPTAQSSTAPEPLDLPWVQGLCLCGQRLLDLCTTRSGPEFAEQSTTENFRFLGMWPPASGPRHVGRERNEGPCTLWDLKRDWTMVGAHMCMLKGDNCDNSMPSSWHEESVERPTHCGPCGRVSPLVRPCGGR